MRRSQLFSLLFLMGVMLRAATVLAAQDPDLVCARCRAWLSYERPNASPQQALKGEQELSYFIGSGQRGRTYLFEKDGYWFESPVNWYSKQRVWDMNPKSIDVREMPFTLNHRRHRLGHDRLRA